MTTNKSRVGASARPGWAKRGAARRAPVASAVAAALATLAVGTASAPAHAFKFQNEWVQGSFDSTVSFGFIRRMENTDRGIIGNDNGGDVPTTSQLEQRMQSFYGAGNAFANPDFNFLQADDGNLNYDKGDIVSAALKGTHELLLHFPNQWSGMLRATWFKDWKVDDTQRTPLDPAARAVAVDKLTWLDAWIAKDLELAGRPARVKLGNQVISWGEDIFIYGGVNVTNAINLQNFHVPGTQLKEIFKPAPMISINANVAEGLSVEGYYQFRWNAFTFDPVGTFFSVTDVIGKGGRNAFLASSVIGAPTGTVGDLGTINPATGVPFTLADLGSAGTGTLINPLATNEPKDSGQFGLATRWLPEGSETEWGLYWIRYHDKLPFVGFQLAPDPVTDPTGLNYFVDYGESRNVFGISANTRVGTWAVGAELSYRPKDSVGIDGTVPLLGPYSVFEQGTVRGFVTEKKWQAHLTGFKLFSPQDLGGMIGAVGAAEGYFLGELAVAHYPSLDRSGRIPYLLTDYTLPDKTSAGLVFSTGLTYANVGDSGWNVLPQLDVAWDFKGTSPNAVPFVDGRKAATLSLNFNRSDKWKAGIGYTRYWGGGGNNLMRDRDFLSVVTSVSF